MGIVKNVLIIICKLDRDHPTGSYHIYVSDIEKPSDERKISGIYVRKEVFRDKTPEEIDARIEWFDEDINLEHRVNGKIMDDDGILTDSLLAIRCQLRYPKTQYRAQYCYWSRGEKILINSLYINKEIIGPNPPDSIFLTLQWKQPE